MQIAGVKVRRARLWDAGRLVPLIRELAGDANDAVVARRYRRMLLRPGYLMYVAFDGRRPVLLGLFRIGHFLGADAPHIYGMGIVVDPEYRGRGLASQVITYAVDEASRRGFNQMWFITQHPHLHAMYEGLGFEKTGTRFVMNLSGGAPLPRWRRAGRSLARRVGF